MTALWRAQLHGEPSDLAKLPGWFDSDIARVSFEGEVCYLASSAFLDRMDSRAIAASAREIVALMTGIALQLYDREVTVRATAVEHWDDAGKGHTFVGVEPAVDMSAIRGLNVAVGGGPASPHVQAELLLRTAQQEGEVADVLAFLGFPHDWHTLWKIWELIRSADPVERGWTTADERDRFKESANRRDISGRRARHARPEPLPPEHQAMDDFEGDVFICRLAKRWLEWRVQEFQQNG